MRIVNEACLGVLPGTFIACGERGYCSNECTVIGAFDCGAAVAFGLMGMFEAIRQREKHRKFERLVEAWERRLNRDPNCPHLEKGYAPGIGPYCMACGLEC